MKLISIILSLFSTGKHSSVNNDCVSKINEAFVGNERYWKPVGMTA
jgi:phosphatidylserine decarboxylase